MRLALAQLDFLIGDLEGNAQRILAAATQAASHGADLLLTSELSLWGYPPRDLLLRPALLERQNAVLNGLCQRLDPALAVLVGVLRHRARLGDEAFEPDTPDSPDAAHAPEPTPPRT